MTNNDLKYSIVIPHKNSYDLLLGLLESIPQMEGMELVIVDDNSRDEEVEKLKNHQFHLPVTLLYNNKPEGPGKAKNIGLGVATGKWIIFADCDDYFTPNLENILLSHADDEVDVVYFGTMSVYANSQKPAYRHIRYLKMVENAATDTTAEDAMRFGFSPPWGKMIKRSLIEKHHIRFDEIWGSDDIMFALRIGHFSQKVSAVPQIFYYVTVTEGNQSSTFSRPMFDYKYQAALNANKYLRSIGKGKYQHSVLYFLGRSYKFGWKYMADVYMRAMRHRSNVFVGIDKAFNYKNVLNMRENPGLVKG